MLETPKRDGTRQENVQALNVRRLGRQAKRDRVDAPMPTVEVVNCPVIYEPEESEGLFCPEEFERRYRHELFLVQIIQQRA